MAVPTSVRLSDELNEKLTLWTSSHNISKSEFIAQILAEKLEYLYDIQEAGKAIQSTDKQEILGNWILRGVFQLKERELLTGKRLNELEINGIRLTKFKMAKLELNSSGLIPKTHLAMPSVG